MHANEPVKLHYEFDAISKSPTERERASVPTESKCGSAFVDASCTLAKIRQMGNGKLKVCPKKHTTFIRLELLGE